MSDLAHNGGLLNDLFHHQGAGADMPHFSSCEVFVMLSVLRVEFSETVHDDSMTVLFPFEERFRERCETRRGFHRESERVRETGDMVGRGIGEKGFGVGFNGLDHAHVEDGYRVEDEPRDLKSLGQVLAPGEEDVGDEDIGRGLFQDSFDLRLDEVRRHVDFCGGGAGGG